MGGTTASDLDKLLFACAHMRPNLYARQPCAVLCHAGHAWGHLEVEETWRRGRHRCEFLPCCQSQLLDSAFVFFVSVPVPVTLCAETGIGTARLQHAASNRIAVVYKDLPCSFCLGSYPLARHDHGHEARQTETFVAGFNFNLLRLECIHPPHLAGE